VLEHRAPAFRAELVRCEERRGEQAEVAEAVGEERPRACTHRRGAFVEEADEQRRADADPLPAEEHEHEPVAHDQDEHPGDEQVDEHEVALEPDLAMQIRDREPRHQEGERRGHRHHHGGQRVDPERDVDLVAGYEQPVREHQPPRDRIDQRVAEHDQSADRHEHGDRDRRPCHRALA
jgi:hypothetical protein